MNRAAGRSDYPEGSTACHHAAAPRMVTVYPSDRALAGLVLAHGAGAGQQSRFMIETGQALATRGITTATFDFPYIIAGRSVPDKAPVLEAAWRVAIDEHARERGVRGAAAVHRRQVDGRPHRLARRVAGRRRDPRAGVSRLSAASAGTAGAAPRQASPRHQGTDAVRAGLARSVRRHRTRSARCCRSSTPGPSCSRWPTAITRSRRGSRSPAANSAT